MLVFRIERRKYLSDTLKGIGASKSKGFRWNSLNTFMVYTSESRALASLEVAVHMDLATDFPKDRVLVTIEIPDSVVISTLSSEYLPYDWDAKPPQLLTQLIGDDFIQSQASAVLRVPSSIIPEEFNYLINPLHPDAKLISVFSSRAFGFDERLR